MAAAAGTAECAHGGRGGINCGEICDLVMVGWWKQSAALHSRFIPTSFPWSSSWFPVSAEALSALEGFVESPGGGRSSPEGRFVTSCPLPAGHQLCPNSAVRGIELNPDSGKQKESMWPREWPELRISFLPPE